MIGIEASDPDRGCADPDRGREDPDRGREDPDRCCEDSLTALPSAAPQRTRLRRAVRFFVTVLVGAGGFAALLWVAPPDTVVDQITHMRLQWVLAAIGFELASCLCYPVIFRRFFPEPSAGVSRRVAWISMGAGAVLPGGNISSAAATGWLLRGHDLPAGRLFARCGALLCLLTLFGFFVNGAAGAFLAIGGPGGPHDLLHVAGPIVVSVAVLGSAWMLSALSRRLGRRSPVALRGLAVALDGSFAAARSGNWRLLGGAGFLLLDMGALLAACHATGHPIGVPALIIGYCIGYLATIVPMPAGLGVLDSGLAASLVLYGMKPAASIGAVLVYHAISIWVPGLGGLVAWFPTRHAGAEARRRRRAPAGAGAFPAVSVPEIPVVPVPPVAELDG